MAVLRLFYWLEWIVCWLFVSHGRRCVLKDCCAIADNAVLLPLVVVVVVVVVVPVVVVFRWWWLVFQGRRCVLKDCCAIADNAVLPPETVVPPFTYYAGSPGDVNFSQQSWISRICAQATIFGIMPRIGAILAISQLFSWFVDTLLLRLHRNCNLYTSFSMSYRFLLSEWRHARTQNSGLKYEIKFPALVWTHNTAKLNLISVINCTANRNKPESWTYLGFKGFLENLKNLGFLDQLSSRGWHGCRWLLLGTFVSELPECTQDLMIDITRSYYQHFVPDTRSPAPRWHRHCYHA